METPRLPKIPFGIIFYSNDYYDTDYNTRVLFEEHIGNGAPFKLLKNGETTFRIRDSKLEFENNGVVYSRENGNLPAWCWFRGNANNYSWEIAYFMEKMGIKCWPCSAYINAAYKKDVTAILLSDVVKMPDTIVRLADPSLISNEMYPMYLKPICGFGGNGVYKVHDPRERLYREKSLNLLDLLYQEAMPTGDDLRLYVLDREIVAGIMRKVVPGKDKANLSEGSIASLYEITPQQREIVGKVVDRIYTLGDPGLISVDFLFDDEGNLVFNEMNGSPGTKRLSELTDIDVVAMFMEYVHKYFKVDD